MTSRILVTRPAEGSDELCEALRRRGLEPIAVPTVAIDRAAAATELDAMLDSGLVGASWLVITSANGATALTDRIAATGGRLPPGTKLAAVGPATARALADAGLRVDHVPDRYLTVAIAEGLGDVAGRRIVLARADAATPDLRTALLERGAEVVEVTAYRTIEGPAASRDALRVTLGRDLAGIAFTSSSTVRGLLRLASMTDRGRARAIPAFCIGPVTARTARRAGFGVAVVAHEHTAAGLAAAIARHLHHAVATAGDR